MAATTTSPDAGNVRLDVCRMCQLVWFDPEEWQRLPLAPEAKHESKPTVTLSREVQRRLAEHSLDRIDRERDSDAWVSDVPEQGWKLWVGMFGIPVENESWGTSRRPWATWLIGLGMILTSLIAFGGGEPIYETLWWVPADTFVRGGLTLLTGFFLHAGWLHLLGNLYFLVAFGDNVEDRLGHGRYLLLLAFADLAGDVAHVALAPDLTIPVVGASGGISGIIACYAVLFPTAKLSLRLVVFWQSMPAYALFAAWILWQVVIALLQGDGLTDVSAAAHLGGALVGVVWGAANRPAQPHSQGRPVE